MNPPALPFILNPSLGCPRILSITDNQEPTFTIIIAAKMPPRNLCVSLLSSKSNCTKVLKPLSLSVDTVTQVSYEPGRLPSTVEDTLESISKELFENVLEPGTMIFKVKVSLKNLSSVKNLRKVNGRSLPTLYDLNVYDSEVHMNKPHAVCLTHSLRKNVNFIHFTDLHLARRNDMIKDEISEVTGPLERLVQFNDNVRKFISEANKTADKGDLDFVLMGGDLVDFVNHGLSDEIIEEDNNWQVFIEILTGLYSNGKSLCNGIKVPVYTTTGNHDWRLHPYDIALQHKVFGLEKKQAKEFECNYYNTQNELNAKMNMIYDKIVKEGTLLQKENIFHSILKIFISKSETWQAKAIVPLLAFVISFFTSLPSSFKIVLPFIGTLSFSQELLLPILFPVIVVILHFASNKIIKWFLRKMVRSAIIPIEAGAKALHYYFLHINPYFNYAFSYGSNHFIMMDTGPDCLVGQQFWNEGNKKARRLSVGDNFIGGAPDSMSFYPANPYYVYGQITWFENVLKSLENINLKRTNVEQRVFVCLHSPPINLETNPVLKEKNEVLLVNYDVDSFLGRACYNARRLMFKLLGYKESSEKYPAPRNARYGTTNHYVSQFLHLCLGKKEKDPCYNGPEVDIVFCGHAHQEAEFRVEPNESEGLNIYFGRYSKAEPSLYSGLKRPLFLQTAAGGPLSDNYGTPPHYRIVKVDAHGRVVECKMYDQHANPYT